MAEKLSRTEAGRYRSEDERFEVAQQGGQWFISDTQSTDDFGQPILVGPMATLAQAKDRVAELRSEKPKKAPRPKAAARAAKAAPKAAPKPEPTWLDRLPAAERRAANATIKALAGLGIKDAESVVRADVEGLMPLVARRVIGARLRALVDGLPKGDQAAVRRAIGPIISVLAEDGLKARDALPGWSLVERADRGGSPRVIQLDDKDLG